VLARQYPSVSLFVFFLYDRSLFFCFCCIPFFCSLFSLSFPSPVSFFSSLVLEMEKAGVPFPPWPSLAFIKPEDGPCFFEKKQGNESLLPWFLSVPPVQDEEDGNKGMMCCWLNGSSLWFFFFFFVSPPPLFFLPSVFFCSLWVFFSFLFSPL